MYILYVVADHNQDGLECVMRSRYSSGDLLDFLLIAEMGSKLGDFDIDSFVSPSGATLHTAALFMAPFCANNASGWPYPHIHKQVEDLQAKRDFIMQRHDKLKTLIKNSRRKPQESGTDEKS